MNIAWQSHFSFSQYSSLNNTYHQIKCRKGSTEMICFDSLNDKPWYFPSNVDSQKNMIKSSVLYLVNDHLHESPFVVENFRPIH